MTETLGFEIYIHSVFRIILTSLIPKDWLDKYLYNQGLNKRLLHFCVKLERMISNAEADQTFNSWPWRMQLYTFAAAKIKMDFVFRSSFTFGSYGYILLHHYFSWMLLCELESAIFKTFLQGSIYKWAQVRAVLKSPSHAEWACHDLHDYA